MFLGTRSLIPYINSENTYINTYHMLRSKLITWKLPRVEFVEVDLGDDGNGEGRGGGLFLEVVND